MGNVFYVIDYFVLRRIMMVKYTILVPVYNKIECLKKYFSRIINQKFDSYEIVVVDDFSTDGSYEYLRELEKHCNKLRVYRNESNLGIGYTRNMLLSKVNSQYVLFIDPDDYVEFSLLQEIDKYYNLNLDVIRFQNIIEPVGERQIANENGRNLRRYSCEPTGIISGEEALLLWCFGERYINTFPWTYVFKKELFDTVKFPLTRILEDFAVIPYLIAKSNRIMAIDYLGYHYLKYDTSLSNAKEKYTIERLRIFKDIIELAKYYMSQTSISNETKELYFKDVDNRYNIRRTKTFSATVIR